MGFHDKPNTNSNNDTLPVNNQANPHPATRIGTDVTTAETHINAFKQEAIDAIQDAYKAVGVMETKLNALIAKYEE